MTTDHEHEFLPLDQCCVQCGDPLPVDALSEGVEFCSEDCKAEYFESDDT